MIGTTSLGERLLILDLVKGDSLADYNVSLDAEVTELAGFAHFSRDGLCALGLALVGDLVLEDVRAAHGVVLVVAGSAVGVEGQVAASQVAAAGDVAVPVGADGRIVAGRPAAEADCGHAQATITRAGGAGTSLVGTISCNRSTTCSSNWGRSSRSSWSSRSSRSSWSSRSTLSSLGQVFLEGEVLRLRLVLLGMEESALLSKLLLELGADRRRCEGERHHACECECYSSLLKSHCCLLEFREVVRTFLIIDLHPRIPLFYLITRCQL